MPLVDGQFLSVADIYRYVGTAEELNRALGGDIDTDPDRADRMNTAVESAEGHVASKISVRYELPSSPATTPARLKTLVSESVPYFVHEILETAVIGENIERRHRLNTEELEKIVKKMSSIDGLVERDTGSSVTRAKAEIPPAFRRPHGSGRFLGMDPTVGPYGFGSGGGSSNFHLRRRQW